VDDLGDGANMLVSDKAFAGCDQACGDFEKVSVDETRSSQVPPPGERGCGYRRGQRLDALRVSRRAWSIASGVMNAGTHRG